MFGNGRIGKGIIRSVIRIMSFKKPTHAKLPINHLKSVYGPLLVRVPDFEKCYMVRNFKNETINMIKPEVCMCGGEQSSNKTLLFSLPEIH